MPRANKANKANKSDRLKEMLPLVSKMSRQDLLRHFKKWEITDRQIDNYIRECNEILKSEFEKFKPNAAAYIYNNRLEIYRQALYEGDLLVARGIQSDIAKMTGVDTASIDITSKGEALTGFTIKLLDEDTADD